MWITWIRVVVAVVVCASLMVQGPTARGQARVDTKDAAAAAVDYVRAQRITLELTEADVEHLSVTDAYRSAHIGITHVYLNQKYQNVEVRDAMASVAVADDGSVVHVGSRLMKNLSDRASGELMLPAIQAVRQASANLQLTLEAPLRVLNTSNGADRAVLFSDAGIARAPIKTRLVYQPVLDGDIRLAWNVQIKDLSGEHWWDASIDAESGKLISLLDYVRRDLLVASSFAERHVDMRYEERISAKERVADGSSYRVFAYPLESPNDGDRSLQENPADVKASPFGWHDTDGASGPEFTVTRGNNVHTYVDAAWRTNTGLILPFSDAQGTDDLRFDFPFHPTLPPPASRDASLTNLFYWNNLAHDVFYNYGFDEVAGNFQVTNYEGAGLGSDSVLAEGQNLRGINNATFATPPDGDHPEMRVGLWASSDPTQKLLIDGAFDAGLILHEYSHGVSDRITGGPSTTTCLFNNEAPSEGWSDWFAISLLALAGDTGEEPRGIGTYLLGQSNRQNRGVRPTPYSTDMAINPVTYDNVRTAAVPHGVGYVWASVLWDVFWDLIEVHGFNPNVYDDWKSGGNNLALQLVADGLKFQPCNPGFVDARDAILQADMILTGGENQCLLWDAFARRGLGFSASQGSSDSTLDGIAAFDSHVDCSGGDPVAELSPDL